MKDNIRASAVCKTWHDIAVSVRDRSPLLVYFNARLDQSKKGWLLMEHNHEGIKRLFFFNPFTREHITLPSLIATGAFGAAEFAFSCAPTSKGCVVCCISNRTPYRFLIHTWNVGAAKWVTEEVNKRAPSKFYGNNNIVFSDGYFWFPDQNGLGVYDPVARTWDTLYVPLPNLSSYLMWITEYQGNIYLVDSVSSRGQMRVIMFRLNRLRLVWEKKKICDGLSSFISDESSIMTYGLPRDMSDIV
uniref:KIB1-4 beta-propeller domain-containing protein n=1 Tax=Brassica campestris TaxID=3711 RepID=A0A3P5YGU8_BRACM|nr:unnamed protein product [Brassica rapa]